MTIERKLLGTVDAGASQAVYIEDVMATYLYNGTGASQTINNGIDLATKGGLVWTKRRNQQNSSHLLIDTTRPNKYLYTDTAEGEGDGASTYYIPSFSTTGYNIAAYNYAEHNNSSSTYVSWTFAKQPKFFDVVTYTGDGTNNRQIAHSLGATPGMVIVKRTDSTGYWPVWHKGLSGTNYALYLNTTLNSNAYTEFSSNGSATMNSSTFCVSAGGGNNNVSGGTYVAYLFADSNSGGFGPAGTDSVVACGSFAGAYPTSVNLGWEPQFVLIKNTSYGPSDWVIFDNMRGVATGGNDAVLSPNSSAAEQNTGNYINFNATGFDTSDVGYTVVGGNTAWNYIYLAIRRGPMKTPTDATKVFSPQAVTGNGGASGTSIGFPADLFVTALRSNYGYYWYDRLRGTDGTSLKYLISSAISAEASAADNPQSFGQDTIAFPSTGGFFNSSGAAFSRLNFRRAPGFFDVVCYTGTGSARTVAHNLGVVPELMIVRSRGSRNWRIYNPLTLSTGKTLSFTSSSGDLAGKYYFGNDVNVVAPTSTTIGIGGSDGDTNYLNENYVAYLFATCPGVSKVFSFTGNGSSQTIDCGFTSGARFVLIKRTDSTGDWYVWDTARGINPDNDPHLSLNTTAAEVTTNDTIDTAGSGFIVNQVAATNVNVNNATYIGLAIA